MKIRYVFVAITLATAAACSSSPTAPEDLRSGDVHILREAAQIDSTARGSGWAGNGN